MSELTDKFWGRTSWQVQSGKHLSNKTKMLNFSPIYFHKICRHYLKIEVTLRTEESYDPFEDRTWHAVLHIALDFFRKLRSFSIKEIFPNMDVFWTFQIHCRNKYSGPTDTPSTRKSFQTGIDCILQPLTPSSLKLSLPLRFSD